MSVKPIGGNFSDAGNPLARLREAPERFDLYSALRLIEAVFRERPRLGQSQTPGEDPIRLGQEVHLHFPPTTLARWERDPSGREWLKLFCFGLLGPNGPLPLHLTEFFYQRLHHARDPAPRFFLDLFHHRLIALFYRAWADKEPVVQFDRPEEDRFARYLGSLAGYFGEPFWNRDAMPDRVKRFFTAHLARRPRNREGLVSILQSYFGVEARIEEFIPEWLPLPEGDRLELGRGRLGMGVVGSRSLQRITRFRIRLGPLDLATYESFLPVGDRLEALRAIVRNWVGNTLSWELGLILRRDQIPEPRLGGRGRVGWSFWLFSREPERHVEDLLVEQSSPSSHEAI